MRPRVWRSFTVVLVTGASGFLGAHCVRRLLADGYTVHGTVRSLLDDAKCAPVRALANEIGATTRLQLVEADLLDNQCWDDIVQGCAYVLHVASPFPIVADETTVRTAVDGTLNVLRACARRGAAVRKVVLTSSCAAVNEGHGDDSILYNEEYWSSTDPAKVEPYPRSKTEAERAAWDFHGKLTDGNNKFQLTCLNPTLVVGPVLTDTPGTSIKIVRRFFSYAMPAVPALHFPLVDVRDVAEAHVRAMGLTETDGQRILVSAQPPLWYRDMAALLGAEFRPQGYFVPRWQAPYAAVWLVSLIDPDARSSLPRLYRYNQFNTTKANKLLKMEFRPPAESLIEMAYSMIERGLIPKKVGYRSPSK